GDAGLAFSPDGIDEMNRNIKELNGGTDHQHIYKVRVYEKADKFAVGQKGNKQSKFVEAAKGTNLFFAVSENEVMNKQTGEMKKKRSFRTIPLNEAITKMKAGQPLDENALFILSPNDLVYLPTEKEVASGNIENIDHSRLYKFVSTSGIQADFIPVNSANTIYAVDKNFAESFCNNAVIQNEFGVGSPKSKNERAITGEMIKETCIPIKVDRLGHILKIGV
ncbi:MAG: type II CRISPR RNA-guided endonuclease Cas9, partial [Prevotella sp.]|nr:type II CRISPR RNA-guided endonuclease Cas9 [Prevotella sp.]